MNRHTRLLLAILSAAITFAFTIAVASASELSVSNQRIRVTWSSLELTNSMNSNTMRCPLTLEGSFASATMRKVSHALIGRVSIGQVNNTACTGGHMTIHQSSLPWHLTYEGFTGALPEIEGIRLLMTNAKYEIESGIRCTVTNTAENPFLGIANLNRASGQVEGLRADESQSILMEGLCGFLARGILASTARVTLLGSVTSISMRLVNGLLIELTPTSLAFGTVEPGELARRTVTITASAAVTINSIRVRFANYFAITDPNRCVAARLAERGTCRFTVVYAAPSEAGRSVEDTVTVESTGGSVSDRITGST